MTVRDSAGIRIVEHSRAAWEQRQEWAVAAEPAVTIGGSGDPADDLNEVVGGYLGQNGEIIFADGPARAIRIHAPDGSQLRSLGGRGAGPGEFSSITALWPRGDSTAVYDISAKRLTVAPHDGSPPRIATIRSSGLLQWMQGSADGRLVTRRADVEGLLAVGAASTRIPEFILVISPDGSSTDTILTIAGPALYQRAEASGFSGPAPVGLGPDSEILVLGDSIVIGTNESYALTTYDLAGRPVRIVRIAVPAPPVEGQDIELVRQKAWEEFEPRSSGMPEEMVTQYRAFLDDQRYAGQFPFYGVLAADPAGHLWVQDYPRPADAEERFTVFDREGRLVARVRMPPGLHFLAAGDDAILGLWRDADDVEQVRVHRLIRPER
ncbi:MAG TPA: hypothetical protein VFT04_00465 [Gemmatimonadales bacterium]|nr:hypothetical protein [Gemmatimonadales bacterium]